jgi:hypothetical protein
MLLCDVCDQGWHMDCLPVPLQCVPEGMRVYASVCVCACVYVFVCVCVCACVCVCVYVYIHVHAYLHLSKETHTFIKRD